MFSFDASGDEAVLAAASESDLAAVGVVLARQENQHVARKVLAATELGARVFDRMMAADADRYRNKVPDKAALREVSWHFGVSAGVAGRWMSLGSLLADQRVVRRAFLDGELSESQASRIAHTLAPLDERVRAQAEEHAVALARESVTVAGLTCLLDELVISLDPEAASAAREDFAEREQDVVFRKEIRGHTNVEATMPAEQALFLQSRIAGLLADLCVHDPRSLGQRKVAALHAIAREQRTLECQCGRDDCAPASDGRTVTEPPSGPTETDIDEGEPERSDCGTRDSDRTAGSGPAGSAAPAGSAPDCSAPDCGASDTGAREADRAESSGDPDPVVGSAVARIPVKAVVTVLTDAPTLAGLTGEMVPYLQGYGPIDPALARALAADATWQGLYRDSRRAFGRSQPDDTPEPVDPGRPAGDGGIVTVGRPRRASRVQVPAHLTAGSGLVPSGFVTVGSRPPTVVPIDPSGHGGWKAPPPGALTYAPGAGLRRAVAITDRTCRGPWCDRPVDECDLDHVVPFNHADPISGGWTVLGNQAPLCPPCHDHKHSGLWTVTMGTDRALIWRHNASGRTIITWPR